MCDDFSDDDGTDELLSAISFDVLPEVKKDTNGKNSSPSPKETQKQDYVNVPEEFPFPFIPYNIQLGFMKALYECLQLGKIGIFESPTGTGKSLSVICGSLKWLRDYKEEQLKQLENLMNEEANTKELIETKSKDAKELDWITEFSEKTKKEEELNKILEKKALFDADKRIKGKHKTSKRKCHELESEFDKLIKSSSEDIKDAFEAELREIHKLENSEENEDAEIVLSEYISDNEADGEKNDSGREDDNDTSEEHIMKIYYCSRTHSQLSQFIKEIKKSPYGDDVSVTTLASRQNMCINENVQRLKSLTLINDQCLELQKSKKSSSTKEKQPKKQKQASCPFYKVERIEHYRDTILTEVRDIEQLVNLGKQMKCCPYYGTRFSIAAAEIVALPYNTMLHRSTRESCGIKLEGNIVIIDEAHNLLETINNIHSVEVFGSQLCQAHSQLSQYIQRYRNKLKAKNLMYTNQILFLLSRFVVYIGGCLDMPSDSQHLKKIESKIFTINDFLYETKLDNINLFKILRYCQKSQISKKLNGFVEKYQPSSVKYVPLSVKKPEDSRSGISQFLEQLSDKQNSCKNTPNKVPEPVQNTNEPPEMRSPLMHIESFLKALTNADKDGRIVLNRKNLLSVSSIKFLLLNPAVEFKCIVNEARAVVVAGGTMQPLYHPVSVTSDVHLESCCGCYIGRFKLDWATSAFLHILIKAFLVQVLDRCIIIKLGHGISWHVIPDNNLLTIALANGPSGQEMDFTFKSRNNVQTLNELGHVVVNMCNVIPCGIVCFFPSYDFENHVYSHWTTSGVLKRISAKKKIFRETRKAGESDQVLNSYAQCIQKCKYSEDAKITGAILFSVVGGKMSEGINFSDDLGRCVMLVGMPYPNINSPELKEKMEYLNANYQCGPDGKTAGQIHYENLCMKAVNQSIGRAIRHQNDYATVLLLDRRYQRPSVAAKLPGWIQKDVKNKNFGPAVAAISKFFASKNETKIVQN
ncbi:ATP-dependent DNA helicase DDX11 [Octopus bimaculoides]|uniref:ATP-dependent DNA helicase DDX11 n=1 Tax=Octopus bimaculoides TaxID=37653 RepID=UPI00071C45F3|nr:ATP-dependent DNA helicase DDX11 [Octopus bimaculoides]|eukprot:XP_014785658.1 PREDICTED: probable ATP-dependent RNA helicase DDX11 [Octopus bimaculoides]